MIPINPFDYLKEHIGCKYSIAEHGKHFRKWSKGPTLTEKDIKDVRINCCQELPNEITLESDYKGDEIHKNKENQEHVEQKFKELGVGYYVSSHKGKSDYVRFRFKTSQNITPKLRLQIIRYLSKEGLKFDENFFSLKYVRPIPNRPHWKHTYEIEKVIKVVEGNDLDIDILGIKEPLTPSTSKISSGSIPSSKIWDEPKGWALSISIKRMSERYNLQNCPDCNTPFSFKESHGLYFCSKCEKGGGLKAFSSLILQKRTGVQLK